MKKYTHFYFEDFSFDTEKLLATFRYSFDHEVFFCEEVFFSSLRMSPRGDINNSTMESLLFHCHIALGISYYKLFPTKKLMVGSGELDASQISFWKKFYTNGLGEFLISNDIDPSGLFEFVSEGIRHYTKTDFEVNDQALLPWGGGKDSIVSALLLEKKLDFTPYVVGNIDSIKQSSLSILAKRPITIRRRLDQNLFSMNQQGYYNGHVPITGMIAFISMIAAYLYSYKYIILSCESSADEPNTSWKGLDINHQYSKSFEFEQDFAAYVSTYMTDEIKYFSLLRGMHEYMIIQIFGQQAEKYFSVFSSCNRNFVINSSVHHDGNWCQKCEKCCFVFLLLSSVLDIEKVVEIFGTNLFEDQSLESTFGSLIGYEKHKPFECVGTYEESLFSFYQALQKHGGELPYILKKFENFVMDRVEQIGVKKLREKLETRDDHDIIPPEVKQKIFIGEN